MSKTTGTTQNAAQDQTKAANENCENAAHSKLLTLIYNQVVNLLAETTSFLAELFWYFGKCVCLSVFRDN